MSPCLDTPSLSFCFLLDRREEDARGLGWDGGGMDKMAIMSLHNRPVSLQSSYLILRTILGAVFMPSLEVRKQRLRKVRALVQNCGASGRTRLQWRQKPCCPELVL